MSKNKSSSIEKLKKEGYATLPLVRYKNGNRLFIIIKNKAIIHIIVDSEDKVWYPVKWLNS